MYSVYKIVDAGIPQRMKRRLIVKAFKDSDAMHKFLCSKHNGFNQWAENSPEKAAHGYPHKSGTYAFAGGQWHNVKSLDPITLAHI